MKYMLMMHAPANAPAGSGVESWKPEEVQKMVRYMKDLNADLKKAGELVAAEGLEYPPKPRIVRADGNAGPLVTDGPFVETKEFLTGFWIIDVPNDERAIAIAARASSAPGPGGAPLNIPIEVRQVGAPPA